MGGFGAPPPYGMGPGYSPVMHNHLYPYNPMFSSFFSQPPPLDHRGPVVPPMPAQYGGGIPQTEPFGGNDYKYLL